MTMDLQFIQMTPGWPMWPYLPLKKPVQQPLERQKFGVLVALDFEGEYFLWLEDQMLYDTEKLQQRILAVAGSNGLVDEEKRMHKDDLHKLTDDGWIVD